MTSRAARLTAVLAGAAVALAVTPAFARGGGGGGHGGGGGGGHFGGGGGGGHYGGGGGHYSSGGGGHYSAPHSSAPSVGGGYHGYSGYHGGYGGYGGGRGYVGRGGVFAGGGRVPVFVGGRPGGVWWGPTYGWRVPGYWPGYYNPYPAYLGLGYWVTDWVMLDLLAEEEARMAAYDSAYVPPPPTPPIDDGVREELRSEVEGDLAAPAEQAAPPPPAASDNTLVVTDPRVSSALGAPHHVFAVSRPISVSDRTHGNTCGLTAADLVRTTAPVPNGQSTVDVVVAGSKSSSCQVGSTVTIAIADLVGFERDLIGRVARGSAAANTAAEQMPAAQQPAEAAPTQSPPAPAPQAPPDDQSF